MPLNEHRLPSGKRFVLLLSLVSVALGATQIVSRRWSSTNTEQQIVAALASWGLSLDGIVVPVDPAEIEEHLAELFSPISEVRVQAADWLASRGIRSSAAYIAAAMDDPGTLRPCQLAKSLGSLGDDQWTDKLIAATQQRSNVDLRVCATIALGELQSPRAIDALIDLYRNSGAPTTALNALSRIADPTTLGFLQTVAQSPRNRSEHVLATQAIERIEVMQQPDPVAALIDRLRRQVRRGRINQWPIRKLATLQDQRAVPAMKEAFLAAERCEQRVWLAASMLVHGDTGRAALRDLSQSPAATEDAARAALNLTRPTTPINTVALEDPRTPITR